MLWGLCNVMPTSTRVGLWAGPILRISFQSCLSPPNATLQLDSPSIHPSSSSSPCSAFAHHLTCISTCSCACACTWSCTWVLHHQLGSACSRTMQSILSQGGKEAMRQKGSRLTTSQYLDS